MSVPRIDTPDPDPWLQEAAKAVARFIPRGARVLEFGSGDAGLASALPLGCVLWRAHGDPTGPAADCDLVVALPYAHGPAAGALTELRALNRPVILALPPPDAHRAFQPTQGELLRLVGQAGFARARLIELAGGAVIRLEPAAPPYRRERSVWVLSCSNVGNFGDRLGHHLLSQVLPPHARVTRLHHSPWDAPPEGEPDLLVLGIGNSLFQPLLTDELLELLGRAKACVGIFGTQYREGIDPGRMAAVLDRLEIWWARYEADCLLFGRGRDHARHLGDWLIDAFPLARPTRDELLTIGPEIMQDGPLDRAIQHIQSFARVASTRLHPLLCALTSAEQVAYREQAESGIPGLMSGKFRSMLLDIFGEEQPEGEFWAVDPTAVADYKTKVRANIGLLRADMERLLA